jgi:release factor glutamine methyltransferase
MGHDGSSIDALVRATAARLETAGISTEEARLDAELLARHVLGGWDRGTFLIHEREPSPSTLAERLEPLVARRERREPIAYILGSTEFWGLEMQVTPAVLVPRPETELIVEEALARLRPSDPPLIVDVGTGSGCLAIALAREFPTSRVVATDPSSDAIAVARANAQRHGVDRRVSFRVAHLLSDAESPDLIVSNPPYVPTRERAALPPEVREFEPALALFAGEDGLDIIRLLVDDARCRTLSGAWLIFEFGYGQADSVRGVLELAESDDGRSAWRDIQLRADLQGIPRTAVARRA